MGDGELLYWFVNLPTWAGLSIVIDSFRFLLSML